MKFSVFALFFVFCIFTSGIALAVDWSEGEWDEGDPGVGMYEPYPGMYEESGIGEPYSEMSDMFVWSPPDEAYAVQPAESPIGEYVTSYESTAGAYYSTMAPPATEQNALLSYNVQTAPPSSVYYSGTYYPWNTFSTAFPGTSPMFWISSWSGWSWYAVCPHGGWVRQLMYIPRTGTVKVYEIYPTGLTEMYNYGWAYPGYRYIWFHGDTVGRHIAIFTVSDNPSNAVTIDVV
jgi:hypothetical protein